MKKLLYRFFVTVVRPLFHSFGLDLVAWHKELSDVEVWKEVLKFSDCARSFVPDFDLNSKRRNVIWQFWWQGAENAPAIVKACMSSVRKYANGWSVVVLDQSNFSEYVNVPETILRRLRFGKMSLAHFSDYLRVSLLSKYGGIWADATVYFTDVIPREIIDARFFMFKSALWAHDAAIPCETLLARCVHVAGRNGLGGGADAGSNWFLSSVPGSPILTLVAKLLEWYWDDHDVIIDYFLFHKFLALGVCVNRFCREEYCSAPVKTNIFPHVLQFALQDEPNEEQLAAIKDASPIHKLTYKLPASPRFIHL